MSEGRFEEIGRSIGAMVAEKDKSYGRAFDRAGEVMRILFPAGIPPEKMDDALGLIRVLDKMFRIATAPEAFGEDPWKDIGGYGILGTARLECRRKGRKYPTIDELEAILKGERASAPQPPTSEATPGASAAGLVLRCALMRWLPGWNELLLGASLHHLAELAAATLEQMGEKIRILNTHEETWQKAAAAEREKGQILAAHQAMENAGRPVITGGKVAGVAHPIGGLVVVSAERDEKPAGSVEQIRQALAMMVRGAEEGSGWWHILDKAISELARFREELSPEQAGRVPVNVEMWCPFCGLQHVDSGEWATRVHYKHLCAGCQKPWRVAPAVFGVQSGDFTQGLGVQLPPALRAVVEPLWSQAKARLLEVEEARRQEAKRADDVEEAGNAELLLRERTRADAAVAQFKQQDAEIENLRTKLEVVAGHSASANGKLDVAAARATDALMRFPGIEEQVRLGLVRAVRDALYAPLEPTHQSALAKLQQDIQRADQRADRATARAAELEKALEKARAAAAGIGMCRLCEKAIAPGSMVSMLGDDLRPVHTNCPK